VGIAIGAVIGLLVILVTKRSTLVMVDALLGAAGFIGGAVLSARVPVRMNTVTRKVGDAIVSTTTRHYQHPYRAALLLAVLLPILWELYRLKVHPLFRRK
jgi:alpha-D-ribose 1-methylphosphonate 5-triphosphate synthase subunit PhnG